MFSTVSSATSGTTLLGADNKAGVAEIVTAAACFVAHPAIPYGRVRIAFTPDEEIGRGTQHFDVARFNAQCAYTMDGGAAARLKSEVRSLKSQVTEGWRTCR